MSDRGAAPIDRSALETIAGIARGHELVERVDVIDGTREGELGHARVVLALDEHRYPPTVSDARLEVQWYENDDYNVHYRERRDDEEHERDDVWRCRWDRHPNPHDAPREHFHPPPDADSGPVRDSIDPEDVSPHYVLSRALAWIRERIENCRAAVEE